MESIKFSIIVPSFNTEQYIDKCITSVINQCYSNYEILIVDDGSTDQTFNIEKQYANKYPNNVFVVQTDHMGVSHARNVAMKRAVGDYFIFLDSDDYLNDCVLKKLNNILKRHNTDVLIGEFDCISDDKNIPILKSERLNSAKINGRSPMQVLNYFYLMRVVYTLWRFIVKRDLVVANGLYLKEGVIHEDEEWVPKMLASAKSFRKIPFKHYVYRKRQNSIMSAKSMFNYHSMLRIADDLISLAEQQTEEYKYLFFLRNAYKLASETYMGLRKMSKPHISIKHYRRTHK